MKAIKFILGMIYGLVAGVLSLPFDAVDLIKDQYFAPDRAPIFSFANPMNLLRTILGALFIVGRNIFYLPVSDGMSLADIKLNVASTSELAPCFPDVKKLTFLQEHTIALSGMPSMLVSYPKQAAIIAQELAVAKHPKEVDIFNMLSISNDVLIGKPTLPDIYKG